MRLPPTASAFFKGFPKEAEFARLEEGLVAWHAASFLEKVVTLPRLLARTWLLLPALLYIAVSVFERRWQSAKNPPERGQMVHVHALIPGGGFINGWFSDGRWWTSDYADDGSAWGGSTKREIRVVEWRHHEGSLAEPWHEHDDYYPPSFADRPKRVYAPAKPARRPETYLEKAYDRALEARFWVTWPPEIRFTSADVRVLLERYFEGLDVQIDQVDHGPQGRSGFDIRFNTLPRMKHYDCGQEPPEDASRQTIIVSLDDKRFHADAVASPAVEALAVGLCVFMTHEVEVAEARLALDTQAIGAIGAFAETGESR